MLFACNAIQCKVDVTFLVQMTLSSENSCVVYTSEK